MSRAASCCVWFSAFVVSLTLTGCGSQSGNSNSGGAPPAPSVSLNQTSVTLQEGGTTQFTAKVTNETNQSVAWSVDGVAGGNSGVGTITSSGLYTAPSATGTHTIAASIVAAPSYTAKAAVNVFTLSVSPASATVGTTGTQQFTAIVQGASNMTVAWSVNGAAGGNSSVGTISSTGLYTASSSTGPYTVTATIASGGASDSANASVNVFAFSLSPGSATVAPSGTQQFSAKIQGIGNSAVTWSVDGVAGGNSATGTINSSGLYTAPNALGGHTITAASVAVPSATLSAPLTVLNVAPNAVLTYHNDDVRDGAYLEETTLTPTTVNSTQFGKIISYPVDGQIYGQPLYLPQVNIGGGTYDVVFVATQNNSLYAFDADATTQATTFWTKNFGPPLEVNDPGGPWPDVGILSTPVIDVTTNTIYVVAHEANTDPVYQLHALNAITGVEWSNSPVPINASYSGETLGNGCYQRMGLALSPVTNLLYIAFGSCPSGWLVTYNKTTLQQVAVFEAVPVSGPVGGGGLWGGGASPAIDDITGDIYVMSGTDNGDQEWIAENNSSMVGYNDSFLRLDPNQLTVLDYFAPDDNYTLATNDVDLGSGGNIIVPGSSSYPHEVLGGGKDGNIFVVNRDDMGGFNGSTNNVLQTVHTGNTKNSLLQWNNIFSTPVYWNGNIYYHPNGDVLHAFSWTAGADAGQQLSSSPTSSGSTTFNSHGATASLSANGNASAIIWEIDNSAYVHNDPASSGPAVLHALDATNVANELYNSTQAGTRDTAGLALKFTVPTIANGRVFIPTGTELDIYGLLSQ
jgi:hypothetical protein